jgi:hypothetical protein
MTDPSVDPRHLSEAVRAALLSAGAAAYEDAGMQGLCDEGRWEAAFGAMQRLDLQPVIDRGSAPVKRPGRGAAH